MDMNTHPSILIVKTSAIGDVIQTFPTLEYLRSKFPKSRIDWVVEKEIAPLLRAHPQIDNVIEIQSRIWRKAPFQLQTYKELASFAAALRATAYDLLFDLQGNTKSAVVTAVAKANVKIGFGRTAVREKCNLLVTNKRFNFSSSLNIRRKYLGLAQSYFNDVDSFKTQGISLQIQTEERQRLDQICKEGVLYPDRPTLMVCFGSRWPNKRLKEATLIALLEKIALEHNPFYLFIFGNEEERVLSTQFSDHFKNKSLSIGNLSLPLWQALMRKVDGVIAVDSAALHLCATTSTPSFSIFGPSAASYYKPLEQRHCAVQAPCPYGRTFLTRCPVLRTCPTGACIREMSADELFAHFKEWFSASVRENTFSRIS
jgi:heptosyltransferase I